MTIKVCLTGATGFVGRNLLNFLSEREDIEITAISRKITPLLDGAKKKNVTWRHCNGFSMIEAEKATEGADVLIYLIHSMMPPVSLSQGGFSEYDLYLADNFARAASKNGVKRIIYLSGLIPDEPNLSSHLKSRLEVEGVLSSYGNKVSTLRAGLIVGKNGSSFRILERLVTRLPLFICPKWTNSKSQPIDLDDVLASLKYCIDNYENLNQVYDIGGPDAFSYKEMLSLTAKALGKHRPIINVPYFSPGLSKLWVSKITATPSHLVYPLVESLKHSMVVRESHQLKLDGHKYKSFDESLAQSLSKRGKGWVWRIIEYRVDLNISMLKNVSSIQRMHSGKRMTAYEVSEEYFKWLPIFLNPFIQVDRLGEQVYFRLFKKIELLILTRSEERSDESREIYYITGGILSRKKHFNERIEFRWIESSSCFLIALLNFNPSLPWFIYKFSQAIVHLFIMNRFQSHLKRMSL
jgi:uncharacterized protein YbjT (DUF2867 family)